MMRSRSCWLLLSFFLALTGVPVIAAEPKDGASIYKDAVPSVVWIHSSRNNGMATGSGSLIDKERRIVLTNFHVVQDNPKAKIFFPVFRDGQPIAEKDYYKDRAKRLAIEGRVIALDKKADLALIRLESIPSDVAAISLAGSSPTPGANVHSIGSAGKSDALYGYVKGTVRQVYRKDWKAELAPRKIASFSAKVIETDSPTNPGDSGGPLLNDAGELVGVTQGGAINAQLISTFIDVSEVKSLLQERGVRDLKANSTEGTTATVEKRTTPLEVQDRAKFFSPKSVLEANTIVKQLHSQNLDVLVLTLSAASDDPDVSKRLRSGSSNDRTNFLRDVLLTELFQQDAQGVGIIICNDPKSLYVHISADETEKFPPKFAVKLRDTLIASLRAGEPDAALKNVLRELQLQLEPKK